MTTPGKRTTSHEPLRLAPLVCDRRIRDTEMSMTYKLTIVEWEGSVRCVYLNDYRIAGSKPWGGGKTLREWTITLDDLRNAIPELQEPRHKEEGE